MNWILSLLLFSSPMYAAEVLKKEKVESGVYVYKIKFEEHTYILFWNKWNSAGNGWFHDPECKQCYQNIGIK